MVIRKTLQSRRVPSELKIDDEIHREGPPGSPAGAKCSYSSACLDLAKEVLKCTR